MSIGVLVTARGAQSRIDSLENTFIVLAFSPGWILDIQKSLVASNERFPKKSCIDTPRAIIPVGTVVHVLAEFKAFFECSRDSEKNARDLATNGSLVGLTLAANRIAHWSFWWTLTLSVNAHKAPEEEGKFQDDLHGEKFVRYSENHCSFIRLVIEIVVASLTAMNGATPLSLISVPCCPCLFDKLPPLQSGKQNTSIT